MYCQLYCNGLVCRCTRPGRGGSGGTIKLLYVNSWVPKLQLLLVAVHGKLNNAKYIHCSAGYTGLGYKPQAQHNGPQGGRGRGHCVNNPKNQKIQSENTGVRPFFYGYYFGPCGNNVGSEAIHAVGSNRAHGCLGIVRLRARLQLCEQPQLWLRFNRYDSR